MYKVLSYFKALFEDDKGRPRARKFFASLCTISLLYVFISTCVFGMNGEPSHLDMFHTMAYFTLALFGISEAKSVLDKFNESKTESKKEKKESED
jgi:hypothetical protein